MFMTLLPHVLVTLLPHVFLLPHMFVTSLQHMFFTAAHVHDLCRGVACRVVALRAVACRVIVSLFAKNKTAQKPLENWLSQFE